MPLLRAAREQAVTSMLAHSCQVQQRHPYSERGHDLYGTPADGTRALLRAEKLPPRIYVPGAGRGAIVNVLRAAGHEVAASDLVDYGTPIAPPVTYGVDFL